MQVQNIDNTNYIGFRGITHKFSKNISRNVRNKTKSTVTPELFDYCCTKASQQKSTIIGQLPPEIFASISNLPKSEKLLAIKEIFAAFEQCAENIRNGVSKTNRFEPLKNAFEKYGVVEKGKFSVEALHIDGKETGAYQLKGLKRTDNDLYYRVIDNNDIETMYNWIHDIKTLKLKSDRFCCGDPVKGYFLNTYTVPKPFDYKSMYLYSLGKKL